MEYFSKIVLALPPVPTNSETAHSSKGISEDATSSVEKQEKTTFLIDCKPLWGCSSLCGRRTDIEDFYMVVPGFTELPIWMLTNEPTIEGIDDINACKVNAHFFGVYDGHGGTQVASYCHERIHHALVEELKRIEVENSRGKIDFEYKKELAKAFTNCFQKIDDETKLIGPDRSGSTALVAVLTSSHVMVANCGNSCAVLSHENEAISLSFDHKLEKEEEQAGIVGDQPRGIFVLDLVEMSRCIGDRYMRPWMLHTSEVNIHLRGKGDNCLILASNGLWDVVSNQEASDLACKKFMEWHQKNGTPESSENPKSDCDGASQSVAESLLKLAISKGSKDNVTVMVIDLKSEWNVKNP